MQIRKPCLCNEQVRFQKNSCRQRFKTKKHREADGRVILWYCGIRASVVRSLMIIRQIVNPPRAGCGGSNVKKRKKRKSPRSSRKGKRNFLDAGRAVAGLKCHSDNPRLQRQLEPLTAI